MDEGSESGRKRTRRAAATHITLTIGHAKLERFSWVRSACCCSPPDRPLTGLFPLSCRSGVCMQVTAEAEGARATQDSNTVTKTLVGYSCTGQSGSCNEQVTKSPKFFVFALKAPTNKDETARSHERAPHPPLSHTTTAKEASQRLDKKGTRGGPAL